MKCKNQACDHYVHQEIAKRFDGYCYDCWRAGVPALVEQRDGLLAACKQAVTGIEIATAMGVANSEGLVVIHGLLLAAIAKVQTP